MPAMQRSNALDFLAAVRPEDHDKLPGSNGKGRVLKCQATGRISHRDARGLNQAHLYSPSLLRSMLSTCTKSRITS